VQRKVVEKPGEDCQLGRSELSVITFEHGLEQLRQGNTVVLRQRHVQEVPVEQIIQWVRPPQDRIGQYGKMFRRRTHHRGRDVFIGAVGQRQFRQDRAGGRAVPFTQCQRQLQTDFYIPIARQLSGCFDQSRPPCPPCP